VVCIADSQFTRNSPRDHPNIEWDPRRTCTLSRQSGPETRAGIGVCDCTGSSSTIQRDLLGVAWSCQGRWLPGSRVTRCPPPPPGHTRRRSFYPNHRNGCVLQPWTVTSLALYKSATTLHVIFSFSILLVHPISRSITPPKDIRIKQVGSCCSLLPTSSCPLRSPYVCSLGVPSHPAPPPAPVPLLLCLLPLPPSRARSLKQHSADQQEADRHALPQTETGLPPSWEVRHSNSKNLPYYFNANEKVSRWEPPPGTDTEKLKYYMASHHSPSATGARSQVAAPEGKIRAAHLLVKHSKSRRPSSWREVSTPRPRSRMSRSRGGFGGY
jgi:hypothetical protein